jgi:hypothetical protein
MSDRALRDRVLDTVERDWFKVLALAVALVVVVAVTDVTFGQLLDPPLWVKVGGLFGVLGILAGYLDASLWHTPPTPDWNLVLSANFDRDGPLLTVDKATDAVVRELAENTYGGTLGHVDGTPIYYCRWWNGDPEEPIGHASWNNVPDNVEFLGRRAEDVEDEVGFLREAYESEIYKADRISTHFPILIRRLHSRKAEDLNAALAGHLTPDMGGSSVDEVVDEVIPDEIQPEVFRERVGRDAPGGDDAESIVDEVETEHFGDDEGVSDLPDTTSNGSQPAVTDGGESE